MVTSPFKLVILVESFIFPALEVPPSMINGEMNVSIHPEGRLWSYLGRSLETPQPVVMPSFPFPLTFLV